MNVVDYRSVSMIEVIAEQSLICGEGPIWDDEKQYLYWTDVGSKALFVYDRSQDTYWQLTDSVQAASTMLHTDGGLMLGGDEGFFHWKSDNEIRIVANECDGQPIGKINDCIAGPHGRVFGGERVYDEDDPAILGKLYRIDLDGSISVVEEGIRMSNGMGFSPEYSMFYYIDTIPRTINVYDYDMKSGNIRNRRTLVTLDQDDGLPDGMTVDSEGFIWVARWFGGSISRYDPEGTLERVIDFPVTQTSNLAFGGMDLNEIYVTTADEKWKTKNAPSGYDYTLPRGGSLYRVKQDIVGLLEHRVCV